MNAVLTFVSLSASFAAATVLLLVLSQVTGKRFSSRCRYVMWVAIVIRMCIPLALFPAAFSIETEIPMAKTEYVTEKAAAEEVRVPTAARRATAEADAAMIPERYRENAGERLPGPDVLIPAAYFGVCVLILTVRFTGYNVTMRRIRRFLTAPDERTAEVYSRVVGEEKIRRAPALYISDRVSGPLLCGFFRKKIVLTPDAADSEGIEDVIRHELTHFRRGDLFAKFLGAFCVGVNFLNPAAYVAVRMMNREMEFSCDEAVLSGRGKEERSRYGSLVFSFMKRSRDRAGAAFTTEFTRGSGDVKKRFRSIMDGGKKKGGAVVIAAALFISVLAGSAVAFRAERPAVTGKDDPAPAAKISRTVKENDPVFVPLPADTEKAATGSETEPETEIKTETETEPESEPETGPEITYEPEIAYYEPGIAYEPEITYEPEIVCEPEYVPEPEPEPETKPETGPIITPEMLERWKGITLSPEQMYGPFNTADYSYDIPTADLTQDMGHNPNSLTEGLQNQVIYWDPAAGYNDNSQQRPQNAFFGSGRERERKT